MARDLPTLLIVGAPRSGTTWLQRMLLDDARCCGGQESHFFATFGRVLRDFDRKAGLERPHGLACYWRREDLLEEIRHLWRRTVGPLQQRHPDARWFIEKTPDHALWMRTIDELLPEARFVHVVRDSRAVAASLLTAGRWWGRSWAPRTAAAAAARWVEHVAAAEREGGRLGAERFLRVRYEDLREDTVGALRRVHEFLGLDTDEAALADVAARHHLDCQAASGGSRFETTGDVAGPTPAEPEGFFGPGSIDGWRRTLSIPQRWLVWRRTASLMRQLGYRR